MTRVRARSLSQPIEEELGAIDKQYEFINSEFKYNIQDLDSLINLLKTRLAAEESYIGALIKVTKATSIFESEKNTNKEPILSFQQAIKAYESSIYDLLENRQNVRDVLKKEIEKLSLQKEHEENERKKHKAILYDANATYSNFRNREVPKVQRSYVHRCEELKNTQIAYQQYEESANEYRASRTSSEQQSPRLSGDYSRDIDHDAHNRKGMAGLISQMRTMATGTHLSPGDQNKQMSKVAKLKKDISDADKEYRCSILTLETLRKKQRKAAEETNRQLKNTIKRKTESIQSSLLSVILTEMECLRIETEKTTTSYTAAMKVDSARDIQIYTLQYQANCNTLPTPVRYENFYFEGKCREVLFGCSLDAYAIEHNRTIPLIVIKCVEAIERNGGLQKEGIYRISGRQSNIEQLKHMFEMDEDKVVLDSKMDVFTISTLLKMFIRELKGPLFRFNVESRLTYSKNMPQNQRFGILESKLSSLSLAHRNTLRYLTSHLANVNANNQVNKMNIQNLAVIFTPVIFHDFNQTEEATYGDWSAEEVFEDLILYHEMLFPIAEENARKLNEASLQKALNGESPYSQHSQSNLLYLSQPPPSAVAKHLLLTQPMTAPVLSTERANESPYPPKLTTIIGHPPRRPSQPSAPPSSALLNPRASTGNLVHETTCIPVQRSTSDTIVLKQVPSVRPAVPLRRDSLRKETHVASYQPELNLDPPPLSPLSEDFKK